MKWTQNVGIAGLYWKLEGSHQQVAEVEYPASATAFWGAFDCNTRLLLVAALSSPEAPAHYRNRGEMDE